MVMQMTEEGGRWIVGYGGGDDNDHDDGSDEGKYGDDDDIDNGWQ